MFQLILKIQIVEIHSLLNGSLAYGNYAESIDG